MAKTCLAFTHLSSHSHLFSFGSQQGPDSSGVCFDAPHRSTLCRPDRLFLPQPPQTRHLNQQTLHRTLQTSHRDRPNFQPSSLHINQIPQTCSTTDSSVWSLLLGVHWTVLDHWTVLMALDLMESHPIDVWLQSPSSSFLIAQVGWVMIGHGI